MLKDTNFAFLSLLFVFCYAFFHMRSFVLTATGLLGVVLSMPVTLFVFLVIFQVEKVVRCLWRRVCVRLRLAVRGCACANARCSVKLPLLIDVAAPAALRLSEHTDLHVTVRNPGHW